jgi:hypothetical protein
MTQPPRIPNVRHDSSKIGDVLVSVLSSRGFSLLGVGGGCGNGPVCVAARAHAVLYWCRVDFAQPVTHFDNWQLVTMHRLNLAPAVVARSTSNFKIGVVTAVQIQWTRSSVDARFRPTSLDLTCHQRQVG